MPRDGSGTRKRIVTTAMRRFVEHGYDKTSLREIADEVGVTKAALYYHFHSKVDIVAAAMKGFENAVTSIQEWSAAGRGGVDGEVELVDRLMALMVEDAGMVLRFAQANPTVLPASRADRFGPAEAMAAVVQAVAGEGASTERVLRATLAVAAALLAAVPDNPLPIPGDGGDRQAAARRVAQDLLRAR